MRRAIGVAGLLLVFFAGPGNHASAEDCTPDPGPHYGANPNPCMPTAEECATGNYQGAYGANDGSGGRIASLPLGPNLRGAICVSAAGHVIFYEGGNPAMLCGSIIVADFVVRGDPSIDPNECR